MGVLCHSFLAVGRCIAANVICNVIAIFATRPIAELELLIPPKFRLAGFVGVAAKIPG
jgi:hypothetical protein